MDKISGILPSNSRIRSVDLKDSQPLRPGHGASFGREMATSEVPRSLAPKLTLNEAPNAYAQLSERKLKDRAHAQIVEKMSNEFFGKREQVVEAPAVARTVESLELSQGLSPQYESFDSVASNSDIETPQYSEIYVEAADYGPVAELVEESSELGAQSVEVEDPAFHSVGTRLSVVA